MGGPRAPRRAPVRYAYSKSRLTASSALPYSCSGSDSPLGRPSRRLRIIRMGIRIIRMGIRIIRMGIRIIRMGIRIVRMCIRIIRMGIRIVRMGIRIIRMGIRIGYLPEPPSLAALGLELGLGLGLGLGYPSRRL
jgi:hypothetical protein